MAKVVTLGPVNSTPTTFEEAFGEFSEIRGKGRARRNKRVSDRQEKRKERKLGRISARDEVKGARQESRLSRKATRKERRQSMRNEQQQARLGRHDIRAERAQGRKDMRTERRMGRRDMRNPEEEGLQNGLDTGVGQEMMDQQTTQGSGYDAPSGGSGSYDQGGADYGDQGGNDQGGYNEGGSDSYDRVGAGAPGGNYQGQGPAEYGEDEAPDYGDEGSEDYGDEGSDEGSDEGGEDYANDGGYLMDYQASDDFNFDGVMGAEDRLSELGDCEATSYIDNLADSYVSSKSAIAHCERKRRNCASPFERQALSKQIIDLKKNLQEVKSKLEGEVESGADGQNNRHQIHRAMKKAHMKHRRRHSRPVTRVQSNLNPAFGPNRIVVPGKSNADGTPTGVNGLDLMNDYDAPRVREIQLGADGSQTSKGLGWGAVIGAVAIGAIAFWAVERYKLLK